MASLPTVDRPLLYLSNKFEDSAPCGYIETERDATDEYFLTRTKAHAQKHTCMHTQTWTYTKGIVLALLCLYDPLMFFFEKKNALEYCREARKHPRVSSLVK